MHLPSPSLNQSIDISTALTLGCLSSTIFKTSLDCRNNCVSNNSGSCTQNDASENLDKSNCPVSSCARLNLKLTAFSATVASGLYLYRAFVKN